MTAKSQRDQYVYDYPRPMVMVDVVALRIVEERLRVLLVRRGKEPFKDRWALPGGFIEMDEKLDESARRELAEETGLTLPKTAAFPGAFAPVVWMDQLRTFGDPGRDPRGRAVSVAYLALLRPDAESEVRGGDDAADARWHNAHRLPKLAFDHREIIRCALERLRGGPDADGFLFHLLPTEFTAAEFRSTCRLILRCDEKEALRLERDLRTRNTIEPVTAGGGSVAASPPRRFRYRG